MGFKMSVTLLKMLAGISAGVAIGIFLGFILTARREAVDGGVRLTQNLFLWFLSRPLREITLFEWFVCVAVVLNACLLFFALSAFPFVATEWLGRSRGLSVLFVYVAVILASLISYPLGRKLWLRRP